MRAILAVTLCLLIAVPVFAAVEKHKVTITQPYALAGKVLQPGTYKVVIEGDQAKLMKGKQNVIATAKVEKTNRKYSYTGLLSKSGDPTPKLEAILIGGTDLRVVFGKGQGEQKQAK